MPRTMIADLKSYGPQSSELKGWIRRIRETKSTTFIVLQDCSGTIQVVADPVRVKNLGLRAKSAVTIAGTARRDERAPGGIEFDADDFRILNQSAGNLPFTSVSHLDQLSPDLVINYRPLALRTDRGAAIFRIEAALADAFRAALRKRRFTEIFTSQIVASATEGGTNLFAIRYFDRAAYLAQSPQFYKEHGVVGLERVFEAGHVYRAEPHASSRHLCEYYSLDLEMGFIEDLRDVIELEREVLDEMFAEIRRRFRETLTLFASYLPSLGAAPVWEFEECLDRLRWRISVATRPTISIRWPSDSFAR
jgi:nondiscriminating aspartyl-tRNA synthetase